MKNKLLYLLILLFLVVLVAGGLMLRQQRQQELAQTAPPTTAPWAVDAVSVERGRATVGFPALALVKGANEVAVAAQLGGIILEMGPREGQTVAKGDLLARIDTRELEDTLASVQAQRDGAVADAERKVRDAQRAQDLLKSHTISQSQVDQERAAARSAEEQVRSLEKQVAAARTRIGYARISAPFEESSLRASPTPVIWLPSESPYTVWSIPVAPVWRCACPPRCWRGCIQVPRWCWSKGTRSST